MSGLLVNVRQISQYSAARVGATDRILVQQAGEGGPYAAVTPQDLVVPLEDSGLAVGVARPPNGFGLVAAAVTTPVGATTGFNWYTEGDGVARYLGAGVAGLWRFQNGFLTYSLAPAGRAGDPVVAWQELFRLAPDGQLALDRQLTLGRDPATALEAATMGWVGRNTVASFMGRVGRVALTAADLCAVLGYLPVGAELVDEAICNAIRQLLATYPAVWSWNGRVGDVWLTLEDFNRVSTPEAAEPRARAPELTDLSDRIATTGWVAEYIEKEVSTVTVAADPPTEPKQGDLWWDSVGGALVVWYVQDGTAQWVVANAGGGGGAGGGASITVGAAPPSGAALGDGWLDPVNNRLGIWDGTTWQPVGSGVYLPFTGGAITGNLSVAGTAALDGTTVTTLAASGAANFADAVTVRGAPATRRYAATVNGNDVATSFPLTHNLGTDDIIVSIYNTTTNRMVLADVLRTGANTLAVEFATAPAIGDNYRVVVCG